MDKKLSLTRSILLYLLVVVLVYALLLATDLTSSFILPLLQ
jgi:uncharacterized membrane protein